MNVKRLLLVISGLLLAIILFLISPELMFLSFFVVFFAYLYKADREMFMELISPFIIVPLALCRWIMDKDEVEDGEA